MKRTVSSLLLGLIAAFWVAQLSVINHHQLSFMVVFFSDPFFILRGLSLLALLLLGYFVWRILQGHRVTLAFGRVELGAFVFGLAVMFILAVWLHSVEPPDYKVFPYVVIPKLFVVALGSFWALVLINFRPSSSLQPTAWLTRRCG